MKKKVFHIKVSMRPMANLIFRIECRIKSIFYRPIKDYRNIPVIINNFNRLDFLVKVLDWLEKAKMRNIYIIDNASTYPPLLEFYRNVCKYPVFYLDKNAKYLALWVTHIYKYFINDYYVYSDPDIVPIEDCPLDVIDYFVKILEKHPEIEKVGFGLKIDDLTDHYALKQQVIDYESKYWKVKVDDNLYAAPIDTTFGLYRPKVKGDWQLKAYRTGYPYLARHLSWYVNTNELNEEEKYYISHTEGKDSKWYWHLREFFDSI
ncbi:MAG: glycosyltransferase family 2 protein [Candidatus Omnitrophica bacterium]|nr:glycosyltransferase family 2 protein [Candidatus Omnitrophota bacterium]